MGDEKQENRMRSGAPKVRRAIYATILALLCAAPVVSLIASSSDTYLDSLAFLDIADGNRRIGGFVFAAIAFISIWLATYFGFGKCGAWMDRCDEIRLPRLLQTRFSRAGILKTAAIIFVLWIPVLVALYPCATTTYDTIDELYQAFSDAPLWYFSTDTVVDASLIDHHPWFDTILFGAFGWLGRSLGSDSIGLFIYGFLQTALTAIALAAAVCYLERLRVPQVIRLVALVFVIFFPIFPATADTMQKDSLFSIALLAYALMYLEAFRTKGEALRGRRFIIGFAAAIALCILTKKTGIYVIGLSTIVLFIALRGVRLRALVSYIAPAVVCMGLLPAVLFGPLNIAPGGSQEMMGFLYQQVVTVMKNDPSSVSDEQRATVDAVLDTEAALDDYRPRSIDYVKRWARSSADGDDKAAFLKTWTELGISHAGLYMQSMATCFTPLVVPSENILVNTGVSQKGVKYYSRHAAAIGQEFHLDAVSPEGTQAVAKGAYSFYLDVLCCIPVISLLCTMGFYGSWIPLATLAAALYSRRRRDACALAPLIASALFLMVSPTPLSRYVLCMVFLAIPAIGWAIRCLRAAHDGEK